jgi:hypothetical protein
MLPYGTPKRHFSVHFAFRIPTKSTLGAWLVPLFGQFQKGNSPKSAKGRATPGPPTRPAAPWLWSLRDDALPSRCPLQVERST